MPPAGTACPPYTLTPRLWLTESRPFLVEPAPFLCAASIVRGIVGATRIEGRGAMALPPIKALLPSLVPCMALLSILMNLYVQVLSGGRDGAFHPMGTRGSRIESLDEITQWKGAAAA